MRRAPWIEIRCDVDAVERALAEMDIEPFTYSDPSHLYFQGPGGLVFRLAA